MRSAVVERLPERVIVSTGPEKVGKVCRGLPVKDGNWGYRLLVVEDLDGNQLFFNYPNES